MVTKTEDLFRIFVYIGLGVLGSGWIMMTLWNIAGSRQAIRCRKEYLKALLSQEMGWFDTQNQSEISAQFSLDTSAYQAAISEKIPLALYIIAMGISGLIVAFINGWLLTLVLLAVFPPMIGSFYFVAVILQNKTKKEERCYAKAGGRAEQALSSIKTVKMLNGQNY